MVVSAAKTGKDTRVAAVASTALAMVVVVKAEGLMVVVVEVGTERCSRRNRCQAHRQHIGFQARRRHKCCLKRMCMYFGTIPAQSVVAAPEAAGECTPAQGGKEAAHKGRMPCRTVRGDFSHRRCACAALQPCTAGVCFCLSVVVKNFTVKSITRGTDRRYRTE